jgi:hypothetical protein
MKEVKSIAANEQYWHDDITSSPTAEELYGSQIAWMSALRESLLNRKAQYS